ncbi:hypothetical protein [Mycolicibacterium aubagnense]|uniref:Uncharacterized protein n=1 Tax=Mycolicibacterium aubagnense TaxID=319707 RepID=A0ABN5Z3Z4_9MYCO|nr:hypothetical protein [Mycolicibacterium aubagnense]TLH48578.1 hypothetical protein C1S80_29810 [Mycolicibacterium aubagnense]BBX87982.1 hypothetical protein MAUB_58550 [Mycolicibacterium aubagnense]
MKVSVKDTLSYDPSPIVIEHTDIATTVLERWPDRRTDEQKVVALQEAINAGHYSTSPLGFISVRDLTDFLGLTLQLVQ